MAYLAGIDLGSSNIKVAVFEEDGSVIAKQTVTNTFHSPRKGWYEYDPEEVWQNTAACLRRCIESLGKGSHLQGVSIASMGEVGIPISQNGSPLYPAISWMDQRTLPQMNWWLQNVGREAVFSISGMPLDPMYSIHRIMWLRDQDPDIYQSMYKWICLPDYIVFKLTGEILTNYSIASRTMAFDVHRMVWSEELCEAANIDPTIFPEVTHSGVVAGGVSAKASEITGLPSGTLVVLGGHDHACATVALGLSQGDEIVDSTGTGEGLAAVSDSARLPKALAATNRYACYPHCVPDKYFVLGHLGVVGKTLEWITTLMGRSLDGYRCEAELPMYFPFLGSDTDPRHESGGWLGITPACTRDDLVNSLMESACFWFRRNLELYASGFAIQPRTIWLTGGLSQVEVLTRLKADVLNRPITIPRYPDLALLGAAMIAGVGTGVYASWEEAFRSVRLPVDRVVPVEEIAPVYQERYTRYVKTALTLINIK